MCSMTTEPDNRLPVPALLRHPRSLSARLTLLFACSAALLQLLAAGYLYWGLRNSLDREDRALVEGKFNVMHRLLEEHPDNAAVLQSEIEHEAEANALLRYYIRVLDAEGRPIMETPEMAARLPAMSFAVPSRPAEAATPAIERRRLPQGSEYLVIVARIETGRGPRILHIALDIEHNRIILAEYRRQLLLALGGGVIFSSLAGWFVARTGLRPLQAMAAVTRRITAHNLTDRLRPGQWPTELQELASSFNAMLDRLRDSFARLTEFSADIAHAMRNPVNNLRVEAEVALGQPRAAEEYQQILGSSLEEYSRLGRMIDGLLFIARTDDPAARIERVEFAAHAELAAVRDFYEALAADKGVTVECTGTAAIRGDPMLFRRAVSNLLANALKHTGRGGWVVLHAGAQPDGTAEITVTDNGPGIHASHLPHIFDRFYQVNKSRDQTSEGAGLGLAIVRSIMRLHGGEARAESEPGRGARFTLRFPAVGGPDPARC